MLAEMDADIIGLVVFLAIAGLFKLIGWLGRASQKQRAERREKTPAPSELGEPAGAQGAGAKAPDKNELRRFLDEIRRRAEEAAGQRAPQQDEDERPTPQPRPRPPPMPRQPMPHTEMERRTVVVRQEQPRPAYRVENTERRVPPAARQQRVEAAKATKPHHVPTQTVYHPPSPSAETPSLIPADPEVPPAKSASKARLPSPSTVKLPENELQRAVVLSEILQPPRALRPWRRKL